MKPSACLTKNIVRILQSYRYADGIIYIEEFFLNSDISFIKYYKVQFTSLNRKHSLKSSGVPEESSRTERAMGL